MILIRERLVAIGLTVLFVIILTLICFDTHEMYQKHKIHQYEELFEEAPR